MTTTPTEPTPTPPPADEEPDFLAGAAACSINPDGEDCEACQ